MGNTPQDLIQFLEGFTTSDWTTPEFRALHTRFSADLFAALDEYTAGRIHAGELSRRWSASIAQAYPEAYRVGARRWGQPMTDRDRRWLSGAVAQEQNYARDFAAEIGSGKQALGASAASRLAMYTDALDGIKTQAWIDKAPSDRLLIYWRLGIAEHCSDCIVLAANSPYRREQLAIVPRSGGTRCLSRCKCHLEFKIGAPSPKTTPAESISDLENGVGPGRIPTGDEHPNIDDLRNRHNYARRRAAIEDTAKAAKDAERARAALDEYVASHGLKQPALVDGPASTITGQGLTPSVVDEILVGAVDGATMAAQDDAVYLAIIEAIIAAAVAYLAEVENG